MYVGPHRSEKDLEAIIALQRINMEDALQEGEIAAEGFVTIRYDVPTLASICGSHHHIIASDSSDLAGYALVLLRDKAHLVPFLEPMMGVLNGISYQGKNLPDFSWFIMGQVCVAKAYRGKGVFENLYNAMKLEYHNNFSLIITEISGRNTRSIRAHEKVGFKTLHSFKDDRGGDWYIVGLPMFS